MATIFNIAKNGGSIKISGCFHRNVSLCIDTTHNGLMAFYVTSEKSDE